MNVSAIFEIIKVLNLVERSKLQQYTYKTISVTASAASMAFYLLMGYPVNEYGMAILVIGFSNITWHGMDLSFGKLTLLTSKLAQVNSSVFYNFKALASAEISGVLVLMMYEHVSLSIYSTVVMVTGFVAMSIHTVDLVLNNYKVKN